MGSLVVPERGSSCSNGIGLRGPEPKKLLTPNSESCICSETPGVSLPPRQASRSAAASALVEAPHLAEVDGVRFTFLGFRVYPPLIEPLWSLIVGV